MPYADWLDAHHQQMDQAARATLDNSALITTFTSGIAAGFVAAAYQVAEAGSDVSLLRTSTALLTIAILCALLLLFPLNRLEDVDLPRMQHEASAAGDTQEVLFRSVRVAAMVSAMRNRQHAQLAVRVASVQAALAISAAAFACWALLDRVA